MIKKIEELDFQNGEVLIFNKPYRWTSFGIIKRARWLISEHLGVKRFKIGHAGTLDPLAQGVLIVCTGKKTKEIERFQAFEKEYIAEIRFGSTTPSFDLETEIDQTYETQHITPELLQTTINQFLGEQEQSPPVFSAKKINGKRAYKSARKGREVEIPKSKITIYELELLENHFPDIKLRIVCSKGTYIRTLANDLGKALHSGAHLAGLLRSRIGEFSIENALDINEFCKIFGNPKYDKKFSENTQEISEEDE
jgi:tRNA pseudouridine55 synthase